MIKKIHTIMGILIFLTVFYAISPVLANDWGAPFANDTTGDGENIGEDILSVDVRYTNEFADFRFIMNEPLYIDTYYGLYIDLDKNNSTGGSMVLGYDLEIVCLISSLSVATIYFTPYGETAIWVEFNITSIYFNPTAGSNPSAVHNFHFLTLINNTQGDIAFGMNWTWILEVMAPLGITWDGFSVNVIFHAGTTTDYLPNQPPSVDNYLEWTVAAAGGIPSFELLFLALTILSVGAFYALKKQSPPH
jgi:hypothetical protein